MLKEKKKAMSKTILTEQLVEKQETLSKKRLDNLVPLIKRHQVEQPRPQENLIELMHWVLNNFESHLSVRKHITPFIHNTIVVDGVFLTFAEEKGIEVQCLYKDSVASWRSDNDFESFVTQGVFKITYEKCEFLQAALFHKGNQNEDEVSFFVIVDSSSYEKYISLRNEFEDWVKARDRDNLTIHVVNGEPIPYDKSNSWDDLFMEEDLKSDISGMVEGFLKSKEFYKQKKIPWKRGALFFGFPGCGKTSIIRTIISQYDFKPVTVQNSMATNDDVITEAFDYAQSQGPSLLYFEDLDTMLNGNVTLSHFLNLMDGVASSEGILVLATANDIGLLKQSVTDRPSRFDRKWEIPPPNSLMSFKYLKKWFGNMIKNDILKEVAKICVRNDFSYSYLKELYITSVYSALATNRTEPKNTDLKKALKQLLNDKKNSLNGFIDNEYEEIGFK